MLRTFVAIHINAVAIVTIALRLDARTSVPVCGDCCIQRIQGRVDNESTYCWHALMINVRVPAIAPQNPCWSRDLRTFVDVPHDFDGGRDPENYCEHYR